MMPPFLYAAGLLALATRAFAAPAPALSTPEGLSASSYKTISAQASTSVAAPVPAPPVVSSQVTGKTSRGAYSGLAPTTTGALSLNVQAASIAPVPALPLTYPSDGQLHSNQPAPYVPYGGLGTNGTPSEYVMKSDFDYESIALALYQEWIELDLFHWGLARFSVADFEAAGLTAEDRFLIEFMADQEVGHATLLTNMLGPAHAPKQCTYNYPATTVREYIDFNQKLTRFGESGVYGFMNHLDSRDAAQLLLQSISTEARQQMIFRQFDGLFPMPVWFETGIPQSWAWTLLAPYISSCPANQTRLAWQNFPALTILNQPSPAKIRQAVNQPATGANPLLSSQVDGSACLNSTTPDEDCAPAITQNKTIPLSYPGREVYLQWDGAGMSVGPNNSYTTSTSAKAPMYVLWVSQLNTTYTPLTNVSGNSGMTIQPNLSTYAGDPAVNGTMFIAITDMNLTVTPSNLSMVNPHVYAGPALYQSG
jgi:hypothetical protein